MGDSRWERTVTEGSATPYITDDIIKCPTCGKINSYKTETCEKCGFNFKTNKKPKNYVKAIFIRDGVIKCSNCGWNQDESNIQCNYCDCYFIKPHQD